MDIGILHVVCYDIASDRLRDRVAGKLEKLGVRVQKSVFEVRGPHARFMQQIESIALQLEPGDSIRAYPLPARAVAQTRTYGSAVPPEAFDFFLL